MLGADFVQARGQVGYDESAGLIGFEDADLAGSYVGGGDFGLGDGPAGWVLHDAFDRARERLSE